MLTPNLFNCHVPKKMGQLTVSVVTFLTVPASVVARTSMSGRSEDSDSLMPQPVKK